MPHHGGVVGAEMGHKHSYYFPDSKDKQKERKMADQSKMDVSIDAAVEKRLNALLPNICMSIGAWFEGGQTRASPRDQLSRLQQLERCVACCAQPDRQQRRW